VVRRTTRSSGLGRHGRDVALDRYPVGAFDGVERGGYPRLAGGDGLAVAPFDEDGWMAEEIPFNTTQRTWERADIIVCGTPEIPYDPSTEIVIAPPPVTSRSTATQTGEEADTC
jgi:hypothetical protein